MLVGLIVTVGAPTHRGISKVQTIVGLVTKVEPAQVIVKKVGTTSIQKITLSDEKKGTPTIVRICRSGCELKDETFFDEADLVAGNRIKVEGKWSKNRREFNALDLKPLDEVKLQGTVTKIKSALAIATKKGVLTQRFLVSQKVAGGKKRSIEVNSCVAGCGTNITATTSVLKNDEVEIVGSFQEKKKIFIGKTITLKGTNTADLSESLPPEDSDEESSEDLSGSKDLRIALPESSAPDKDPNSTTQSLVFPPSSGLCSFEPGVPTTITKASVTLNGAPYTNGTFYRADTASPCALRTYSIVAAAPTAGMVFKKWVVTTSTGVVITLASNTSSSTTFQVGYTTGIAPPVSAAITATYEAIPASCIDSDGGKSIYTAGLTDSRLNGVPTFVNDTCVAANGGSCSGLTCTAVSEGFCNSGKVAVSERIACPTGYFCSTGRCVVRVTPRGPS